MLNCRKPHAWKSGAAKKVRSRACSGIAESMPLIASITSGELREAPFGVPVLPLVRRVILPGFSGGSISSSPLPR